MADVEALDHTREPAESQALAQACQGGFAVVAAITTADKVGARVAVGQIDQLLAVTSFGDCECDLTVLALTKPCLEGSRIVCDHGKGEEDLIWDKGSVLVVEQHEVAQDFGIGKLHALARDRVRGQELALTDMQNDEFDLSALAIHAYRVLVE